MPKMGFISALRKAVSIQGETLQQFGDEYKKLTDQDKTDLHAMLQAAGIECEPPKSSTATA